MAYVTYGSRRKKRGFFRTTSLTNLLIFVNVVAFFVFLLASAFFVSTGGVGGSDFLINFFALTPALFMGGYVWTLLTSMFMHAGFFHLFVNMFSLFFLGNLVERIIGRKRYFWFYMIAGFLGGLFFVGLAFFGSYIPRGDYLFGTVMTPAVGASGALFGLLGILAVLLPHKKVYLIVGPLVVIILQIVLDSFLPANVAGVVNFLAMFLIFAMIFSLFSANSLLRKLSMPLELPFWLTPIIAIVPLVVIGFFVKLPIGNSAHFGGLVAGLTYGAYLRKKYSRKIERLNRVYR